MLFKSSNLQLWFTIRTVIPIISIHFKSSNLRSLLWYNDSGLGCQCENAWLSLMSSHSVQKSQRLGLYPVQPSQHPVVMQPALGNDLLFVNLLFTQLAVWDESTVSQFWKLYNASFFCFCFSRASVSKPPNLLSLNPISRVWREFGILKTKILL